MQKRMITVLIVLQVFLLANGAEALVISNHFMTSDVPSPSCVPPTPVSSFSPDVERIYSWVSYSGFTAGDRIDFEFIDPDGSLYEVYAVIPPPFGPPDGCGWGWIDPASGDVYPGAWSVDVYVNNVYVFSEFFEIERERACPLAVLFGEHSPKTELLRSVRDNILNQSREGRELIRLYYQWGPFIVKAMETDEELKGEIKGMVEEILPVLSP